MVGTAKEGDLLCYYNDGNSSQLSNLNIQIVVGEFQYLQEGLYW